MALFRFSDVASNVGLDDLTLLVRETATILLDPRFSAESDLDDATCAQMAKAINKTAVNAATGAPRHTSFHALITIQQQLATEANDAEFSDAKDFNGRLSRVISRLFLRVIKAEEAAETPYTLTSMDMESLVSIMDDTLDRCRDSHGPYSDASREMVSSLTESILKVHGGSGQIRKIMEGAAISTKYSSLADLVSSLSEEDLRVGLALEMNDVGNENSDNTRGPSIAELVTALGNSKEGLDRGKALAELRRHKDEFGTAELEAYLEEVSPPFRKFIEDQLASGASSPANSESCNSMSERLRKLRTRLQATERAVQPAIGEDAVAQAPEKEPTADPLPNRLSVSTSVTSGPSRSTRLAHPSPRSRLAQPSPSRRASAQSGLALPSPSKVTRGAPSESGRGVPKVADGVRERHVARSSSASGTLDRTTAAANLRARLEAVKHGKN